MAFRFNKENNPRTICLLSDSCLDVFPHNTKTNFSNYFHQPIKSPDTSAVLYVRLKSICLSLTVLMDLEVRENSGEAGDSVQFFSANQPFPGYIKVLLRELSHQVQDDHYTTCLGGFTYPPPEISQNLGASGRSKDEKEGQRDSAYGFHQFQYTSFLPLTKNSIGKLGIQLLDSNNKPIILGGFFPTIIELEMSDSMAAGGGSFSITCTSNGEGKFPHNTLSHFTSPLPSEMQLHNYEVALTSLVYPGEMCQKITISFLVNDRPFYFEIDFFYGLTKTLLSTIQDAVSSSELGNILKFGQLTPRQAKGKRRYAYFINISDSNGRTGVELNIECSLTFLHAMGQIYDVPRVINLKPGEVFLFEEGPPDIRYIETNPSALLECSIVDHSIVGSRRMRLLQTVPVKATHLQRLQFRTKNKWIELRDLVFEPSQLVYSDVISNKPFSSITFTFHDPSGFVKKFKSPAYKHNAHMIVTLHFRQKKQ